MKKFNNFKITKFIFAGLMLAAFIIRIIQLTTIFDFETGFFTNHNNPLVIIFYFLTVISFIGLTVTEYAGKDTYSRFFSDVNNVETKVLTNRITGFAQIILAALILFDSRSGIISIIDAKNKYGLFSIEYIAEELGGKVYILVPIFGILSVLTLIIHAVSSITAKHFEEKTPIISLLPVFWSILKVIETFTVTASYIKQSELYVEIFAFTFSMIAFLGYSRIICNIGIKESGRFFVPASFSAAIFSLMAFVYGIFASEIKENIIFAGLFIFFISLVYNYKASEIKGKNEE